MPVYEAHFRNTFGAEPTGTDEPDLEILARTNPETARIPVALEQFAAVVDQKTVQDILKVAPTGKACGEDEIHGEMIQYAAEGLSGPVTTLFRIFTALCCVPTVWKVANVALVWKNKGSNDDIKQYRPISLTSRIRMVYERVLRVCWTWRRGGFANLEVRWTKSIRSTRS
jgi:hypothetical protein